MNFKSLYLLATAILIFSTCEEEETGPVPVIVSIAPLAGPPGTIVLISGENFNWRDLSVKFGEAKGDVRSVSPHEILVAVPPGAVTAPIVVRSNGESAAFPHEFTVTDEPLPTRHTIVVSAGNHVASMLLSKPEFDSVNQYPPPYAKIQELIKDVYNLFEDDFDFIFMVHNNKLPPAGVPSGWEYTVSTDIHGLGLVPFDASAEYGSTGRLKALMTLNWLNGIENGPLLHEIMHYWANFGLKTETYDVNNSRAMSAGPHWGFSGCGGVLGGFDQSKLRSNIDGNPDKYLIDYPTSYEFSNFELYLMGLIPPQEIIPFDVLTDIVSLDGPYIVARTRNTYDRGRIERELGIRTPDHTKAQRSFRALVLVLTPIPLTEEEMSRIDAQAALFSLKMPDDDELHVNFFEAAGGRAEIELGALRESMKF